MYIWFLYDIINILDLISFMVGFIDHHPQLIYKIEFIVIKIKKYSIFIFYFYIYQNDMKFNVHHERHEV